MSNFESDLETLSLENLILNETNNEIELVSFIKVFFDLEDEKNLLLSTSTIFNIKKLVKNSFKGIINFKKINDVRFINKFLEEVNAKLPISGMYFGCVETYPNRRQLLLKKYPFLINYFIYFFDTVLMRVFPKLFLTKKLYFYLTKGRNRVLSRAETYGRLYSCGFEIVDEKTINNMQFYIARKIKEPFYDNDPTYGPIIRLKRVGKDNNLFNVYKLRTMHPFSEYLQEYIYNKNKLDKGGKIFDDFRISPEGRIFRKFWLDEIPMIINLIKGNVKLVGVRPLSQHYFSLYSKELQNERVKFKPGLFPPFYVDLPQNLEEIMASELKYLKLYEKSPFLTDLTYFFLSLKNIIFKRARSK